MSNQSQTLMLFFKVTPKWLLDNNITEKICHIAEICIGKIECKSFLTVGNGDCVITIIGENSHHAIFRTFLNTGIVNLDVTYSSIEKMKEFVASKYCLERLIHGVKGESWMEFVCDYLEKPINEYLGKDCLRLECIHSPIKRGDGLFPYFITSDERILEHDYDELVFETDSKWQNIKIYHSVEYGNVLYLENDIMFGENDIAYCETILGLGNEKREEYAGKEILILGGGDGGLINMLRQEDPKMVTMVEIDFEVIKACRRHMRMGCGNAMDELSGPNHEIIIDDCMNILSEYNTKGKKIDYVINDLTEFPVDQHKEDYFNQFETGSRILELGLKILKPGGKLLARVREPRT